MVTNDLALHEARSAIMLPGPECVAAYDRLVERYGADDAGRVWSIACREYDDALEPPAKPVYAVLGTISRSAYPAMPYGSQTTIQFLTVGNADPITVTLDSDQVHLLADALQRIPV